MNCIALIKAIHGSNISLSTVETVLLRNGKTAWTLASIKCSQKQLFDAVESELAVGSNSFEFILISNNIMYRRANVRKQAKQKDPQGVDSRKADDFIPKGMYFQSLILYGK